MFLLLASICASASYTLSNEGYYTTSMKVGDKIELKQPDTHEAFIFWVSSDDFKFTVSFEQTGNTKTYDIAKSTSSIRTKENGVLSISSAESDDELKGFVWIIPASTCSGAAISSEGSNTILMVERTNGNLCLFPRRNSNLNTTLVFTAGEGNTAIQYVFDQTIKEKNRCTNSSCVDVFQAPYFIHYPEGSSKIGYNNIYLFKKNDFDTCSYSVIPSYSFDRVFSNTFQNTTTWQCSNNDGLNLAVWMIILIVIAVIIVVSVIVGIIVCCCCRK